MDENEDFQDYIETPIDIEIESQQDEGSFDYEPSED